MYKLASSYDEEYVLDVKICSSFRSGIAGFQYHAIPE